MSNTNTLTIISYNVNGIRAAIRKGLLNWLADTQPNIVCLQETKAHKEQVDVEAIEQLGYHHSWHSAEKKGYSGVAIFSKTKPDLVVKGCNIPNYDCEGRILRADFGDLTVVSVYIPSGSSGDARQALKMEFLDDFYEWVQILKKERPNLIICGDYNICHKAIDIHDPVRLKNASGFKPEERAWMDKFFNKTEPNPLIDTFRMYNTEPHHYSWWSYRANARNNNKGWRIDYHAATQAIANNIIEASILPEVKHSDHCPVKITIQS